MNFIHSSYNRIIHFHGHHILAIEMNQLHTLGTLKVYYQDFMCRQILKIHLFRERSGMEEKLLI